MPIKAEMKTFGERLQYLIDISGMEQKDIAIALNCHETQISKWKKKENPPHAKNTEQMAVVFKCDHRWLRTGLGKQEIDNKEESTDKVVDFKEEKSKIELIESNNRLLREKFKEKCCVLFDDFFDYIAETYGEDKDAVDEFLERLQQMDHSYASWLAQKKGRKENSLVDTK